MIRLRYIGRDGSMGLRKGSIYYVSIYTIQGAICVHWGFAYCPYLSLTTLLQNWEELQ